MKIDFKRVEVFTNIAKTECVVTDIREAFADLIYTRGTGIKAHALAMKIYNSDSETEWTEEETKLIKAYSELCTPSYLDAINKLIEK